MIIISSSSSIYKQVQRTRVWNNLLSCTLCAAGIVNMCNNNDREH